MPSYHLLQMSVEISGAELAEFQTKTEAIRSCDDALELARSVSAQVSRDRFVRASQLPSDLRDVLKDTRTGRASPLFGTDGTVRTLVICNRL